MRAFFLYIIFSLFCGNFCFLQKKNNFLEKYLGISSAHTRFFNKTKKNQNSFIIKINNYIENFFDFFKKTHVVKIKKNKLKNRKMKFFKKEIFEKSV